MWAKVGVGLAFAGALVGANSPASQAPDPHRTASIVAEIVPGNPNAATILRNTTSGLRSVGKIVCGVGGPELTVGGGQVILRASYLETVIPDKKLCMPDGRVNVEIIPAALGALALPTDLRGFDDDSARLAP